MVVGIRLDDVLQSLWRGYLAITPQAQRIHQLLIGRGDTVVNDHIALRTFDLPGLAIEDIDRVFVACGYQAAQSYEFPDKKLFAYHYQHPEPGRPKLFVSALLVDQLSAEAQEVIARLVAEVPAGAAAHPLFVSSGRPWRLVHADYQRLAQESEYAAWLAAFGFRANHFTVDAGKLASFPGGLAQLNRFLADSGVALNQSGGEIKGSPAQLLEQSSTLADEVEVEFADGERHRLPSCYVEFARRYPGPDGQLFQGFIAGSATRLFESTDRR